MRIWRNWNSSTLLVGMYNGTAGMENSLAVPQKVKHRIIIWPSNWTPRSKRFENICSPPNLYMNVHGSIIHNRQNVETTQMFINWWMYKQNVVYPNNGILFSHEKEGNPVICNNMGGPWGHYAKWDKPETAVTFVLFHELSRKGKTIATESKLMVARTEGRGVSWEKKNELFIYELLKPYLELLLN